MNRFSVLSALKWVYPPPVDIPAALRSGFGASDFMLQALTRRGIQTPSLAKAYLDFHQYVPSLPNSFTDMTKAANRIQAAITRHETIGVWGDFDVDGQTSTSLLVQTLRFLGANLRYHIPIRSRESHGIKLPALKEFLTPEMKVLLTCDTGITAHEAADYLNSAEVDLIITDHHSLPEVLPKTFAVINPHLLPPEHPLSTLAGVGVAYKLAEQLLIDAGKADLVLSLHDLVALGCIADVASLTADTRYLVQSGLDRMRTAPRPFLSKMASMLDLPLDHLSEEHIGFYIAPRMNAVGRLADANPMVDLLLSEDEMVIKPILDRMEALNASRRVLVNQVFDGALAQLDANPSLMDQPLLVLAHPEWPAGVVGIAAGRLAELTHRPVILLTNGSDGTLRGSARSVEGIDITAALAANQSLLSTFGGHPMAAGLSLAGENLPEFRARMQMTVDGQAAISQVEPELQIESVLPLERVDFDLLNDLDRLAPFGAGNPAPVFSAPDLSLDEVIPMGKNSEHRRMAVLDANGNSFELLWWQGADLPVPEGKFDLAYTAHLNLYRGSAKIQFEWVDLRPAQDSPIDVTRKTRKSVLLIDRRQENEITSSFLAELSATGALIWSEGHESLPNSFKDRAHVEKSRALVILTIPPSSEVLQGIIAAVKPSEITFFGIPPRNHSLKDQLGMVGRAVKDSVSLSSGRLDVLALAALCSTTTGWIRTALQWYAARGDIRIVLLEPDIVQVIIGGVAETSLLPSLEAQLKKQIEEIAAYRRYYQSAPLATLLGQGRT